MSDRSSSSSSRASSRTSSRGTSRGPSRTAEATDKVTVRITDETFVEGMAGLRWQLRALVLGGARIVVADVADLRQMSSTAVAALLSAHRVCRLRGGGVVIRHPNRRTLDLLHRTGLHRVFHIELRDWRAAG